MSERAGSAHSRYHTGVGVSHSGVQFSQKKEGSWMAIILAITNSKGGVGKTTTCANLAAALSAAGKRVLLVDNDPQGDLTKVMRADPKTLKYTLANLMNAVLDDTELEFFMDKTVVKGEGVHYIPANSKLAGVSSRLVALQMSSRYRGGDSGGTPCELVMARVLDFVKNAYDYILIDCGHSMDLLTINALAAAHQAIVPVQAHYLAMEDMADTLEVIKTIRQGINPNLAVGGILLTMYQGRTNLCRSIREEYRPTTATPLLCFPLRLTSQSVLQSILLARRVFLIMNRATPPPKPIPQWHRRYYPMPKNKIQDALRHRKQAEAMLTQESRTVEEPAYQCFFRSDDMPFPLEDGVLCTLPLLQLKGFPDHEEHFPLYAGKRLNDMVKSIRRHGVQSPILVWKTSDGQYVIISGHNRVNASIIAGPSTIPAVVRTDLTSETAEDLFFEMNFRQRSLADMLFSQRVLCVSAHYNMMKRQGRRTDLESETTSLDTQEKSETGGLATSPDSQKKLHTDAKVAEEYELTRDKVSKYCRYATLYYPLLLLMDRKKSLGQLAAYEISFVTDYSLQECIYQAITQGGGTISKAKGKTLRSLFEAGKLDETQIKLVLLKSSTATKKSPGRCVSVTISPAFESYWSC